MGFKKLLSQYRIWQRVLKFAFLIAVLGFLAEGTFELRTLYAYFAHPPSIPGQSKIIEHFAMQHLLFPFLGLSLAFLPILVAHILAVPFWRWLLSALMFLIALPETIVSFIYGDLFRPYPFDLKLPLLEHLQIVSFGSNPAVSINLLQLQHLILNHWMYVFVFLALAHKPERIRFFAGPRTSFGFSAEKV